MKRAFTRAAPVQQSVIDLLEASPMPWERRMIQDWFGWSKSKAGKYLTELACRGRIANIGYGTYTATGRVPSRPSQRNRLQGYPKVRHATSITDEVLAAYGFNL